MLLTVFLLLIPHLAHGLDVGLGSYTHVVDVRKRPSESTAYLNNLQPYLSISHRWSLGGKHFFSPELGYVFGHQPTKDKYGDTKKTTLFLLYDFAWAATPNFFLNYGIGTFRTTIKGDGGQVTIPSGYTTSTAQKPSGESTSNNMTLNLGAEYVGKPNFLRGKGLGAKIELFLFSFMRSEKRTHAYAVSVRYFF